MTRALNRSYDEVPITTASAYKMLLTFLGVSSQIFVTDGYAFHNRLMVEKVLSTYNRHRLFISPKLNVLLDDNGEDMFAPITNAFKAFAPSTQSSDTTAAMVSKNDYDVHIHDAKTILKKAVEARTKDPSEVFTALVELEKLMR